MNKENKTKVVKRYKECKYWDVSLKTDTSPKRIYQYLMQDTDNEILVIDHYTNTDVTKDTLIKLSSDLFKTLSRNSDLTTIINSIRWFTKEINHEQSQNR